MHKSHKRVKPVLFILALNTLSADVSECFSFHVSMTFEHNASRRKNVFWRKKRYWHCPACKESIAEYPHLKLVLLHQLVVLLKRCACIERFSKSHTSGVVSQATCCHESTVFRRLQPQMNF